MCMDANEPMHGPHNGVQKLLSTTGMVDAISHFHGDDAPKTYLQGRNLIYHMFVTPGIIPCIQRSGHLGIQDGIPSDHVGCWLESNGAELFRGSTENLETIQQKTFTMCDTEQLKIFTEKMETHLTIKQVERRLEEFKKIFSTGNLATRYIDNDCKHHPYVEEALHRRSKAAHLFSPALDMDVSEDSRMPRKMHPPWPPHKEGIGCSGPTSRSPHRRNT